MNQRFYAVTLEHICRVQQTPYLRVAAAQSTRKVQRDIPAIPESPKSVLVTIEQPDMFCGRVDGATIFPNCDFVFANEGAFAYAQLTQNDSAVVQRLGPSYRGPSPGEEAVLMAIDTPAADVSEECVFVGGNRNFGHFVIEALMRTSAKSLIRPIADLPIAVYDDLPARYYEFFDLLGYPAARRVAVDRDVCVRFEKLWCISAPMFTPATAGNIPRLWPDAVWALRNQIGLCYGPLPAARPRYYVPRGNAAWRRILNENAVIEALANFGIQPIALEMLSARQQIAAVSVAELIVTAPGAGSQISTFVRTDCCVVDVASPDMSAVYGPLGMAAILGQPFARLAGRRATDLEIARSGLTPNPSKEVRDRDMVVDVEALHQILVKADAWCRTRL